MIITGYAAKRIIDMVPDGTEIPHCVLGLVVGGPSGAILIENDNLLQIINWAHDKGKTASFFPIAPQTIADIRAAIDSAANADSPNEEKNKKIKALGLLSTLKSSNCDCIDGTEAGLLRAALPHSEKSLIDRLKPIGQQQSLGV